MRLIDDHPKSTQIISDIALIIQYLQLDTDKLPPHVQNPSTFAIKIPAAFLGKIKRRTPNDPLLLQVLSPQILTPNLTDAPNHSYSLDPLCEKKFNKIQGLLHKYPSRVLITTTGACLVHCRYCFRQHFDYSANLPDNNFDAIMDYINADDNITEVILSGGDPLALSNRRLAHIIDRLCQSHVQTIRIHTRTPIVMPARVDLGLLDILRTALTQKNIVMVVHANHAQELDAFTTQTLQSIANLGVMLLNQSVLLRGVNDNADALIALSYALQKAHVLPYYLHVLDKVLGAEHFSCSTKHAVNLHWSLLQHLPGYLVPKLVVEEPDKLHKTPVDIYKHR